MCNKKFYLVFILIMSFIFSLWGINDTQSESAKQFTIIESGPSGTVVQFTMPEFKTTSETIEGKVVKRVECEASVRAAIEGVDEVPVFSTMVAIPNSGNVELQIIDSDNQIITSPFTTIRSSSAVLKDDELITRGSMELGRLSEPVIFRDLRVVSLTVSPVKNYNLHESLEVATTATFRIVTTPEEGENELEQTSVLSSAFLPLYRDTIANFDLVYDRFSILDKKRLLIVYGGDDDPQYQIAIEEFITWKKQKGYLVTSASTTDIGSSTTDVKAYIQSKYNNIYTRPDYVMLIGDVSGSLSIGCYSIGGGDSDYPYALLGGSDNIGDVFIGRLPAENVFQFLTMANKVYTYERDTIPVPPTWYNEILLVGDTQPSGQSCINVNKYMKEASYEVNNNYNYTELYSSQPSPNQIDAAINQGVSFFHYRGFIGMSGWDMPNESSFTNANRLPHCLILTCSSGNFGSTDVSDAFVKFGTPALPKGGLTAIGMSTSSTHTMLNNALSAGVVKGIFSYGLRDMSAPLLLSKINFWNMYNDLFPAHSVNSPSWCNLMGDPTVEVFVGVPQDLNVVCDENATDNQSFYGVEVTDSDGNPVHKATVTTLYNDEQEILYTDINGRVVFELNEDMNVGEEFVLTISKHDHIPEIFNVSIVEENMYSVNQVLFEDEIVGDGNGYLNAGESVELYIELTNNSLVPTPAIDFELFSTDPYITIEDESAQYGEIGPNGTETNIDPFIITIDPNTPDNYQATLSMECTGYSSPISINIINAVFEIDSFQLYGTNGTLEPSEEAYLSLGIVNTGTNQINGVNVKLTSDSPLVYFGDDTAFYGMAVPGSVLTNITDGMQIIARPELLTGQEIPINVEIYNGNGYSTTLFFNISSGATSHTHPTGSDNYGHYVYHSSDTDWDDASAYNWVEIAPQQGGNGTIIPMTDNSSDSDNSDHVGITALGTRDLPFTFTFYGEDYTEFTACSNGFMTLGTTEISSCRNLQIPGPMTPTPILAPFWDNLEIHNDGGIYYWFDEINHQMIIEWYNVKNSFSNNVTETFQVVLFDPDVYPTSTGDGMVKFQYHTFNDIDAGDPTSYTPGHGQFCTIGFGDHTGADGIGYLFDQEYAFTSQPIADNTAILFSGEPYVNLAPQLNVLDYTYTESNDNGFIEPGESVQLRLIVENSGIGDAEFVMATITSTNPNVVIENGLIEGLHISSGEIIETDDAFELMISDQAQSGSGIYLTVQLSSGMGELFWEQEIEISVIAPHLEVISVWISDSENGDEDGEPDSPEQLYLAVNAVNYGSVDMFDISTTLTCEHDGVTIGTYPTTIPRVLNSSVIQSWYPVTIPSGLSEGYNLDFSLTFEDPGSFTSTSQFTLVVGDDNNMDQAGLISGNVTSTIADVDLDMAMVNKGTIYSSVSDTGDYKLFCRYGTVVVEAALDHHMPEVSEIIPMAPGSYLHYGVDFELEPLSIPENLLGDFTYPTLSLDWDAPGNSAVDVIGYNVYKRVNEDDYQLLLSTNETECEDALPQNGNYYYYVEAVYLVGTSYPSDAFIQSVTDLSEENQPASKTELTGNYPNPFNPSTNIAFGLAAEGRVEVLIYNVRGQLVRTLLNEVRSAGTHSIEWDGMDNYNKRASSGLYLIKFESNNTISTKKALLLK